MQEFDFHLRTRIVRGNDAIDRLGQLAAELGIRRALVVSDPGIVEVGHVEHGLTALRDANIETYLFGEAHENPTTDDIDAGLAIAKEVEPELIVGLGGGSSMD